jgi:hypothetical protein
VFLLLQPTYGYSASGAQLLGRESGAGVDIKLSPHKGEFITKFDVATSGLVCCLTGFLCAWLSRE